MMVFDCQWSCTKLLYLRNGSLFHRNSRQSMRTCGPILGIFGHPEICSYFFLNLVVLAGVEIIFPKMVPLHPLFHFFPILIAIVGIPQYSDKTHIIATGGISTAHLMAGRKNRTRPLATMLLGFLSSTSAVQTLQVPKIRHLYGVPQ